MGPEQAASVLTQVRNDSMAASGKEWPQAEMDQYRSGIEAAYNEQASAYYATARLWDDGIIDPAQTRETLALSIGASLNRPWGETSYGVFRT